MAGMFDRGLALTIQAIRRQLAAMPYDLYLVRLIHSPSRRAFPGERLWTAAQLTHAAAVRFLRVRNREGCDIYLLPYAENRNAGYILLDLDSSNLTVLESMRANGHEPCVVLQTSPSHLQAWIHLSRFPLEPAAASAASKWMARAYGADLASTGWRHLGRLAGFTNQKPQRRTPGGYPPWVKILYAHAGLASNTAGWPQSIAPSPAPACLPTDVASPPICTAAATKIYQTWVKRWRIAERFPQPDWSIVDLWIARQLLLLGTPVAQVKAILRLGSPHFPRGHGAPDDYLCRTLGRAAFPAPGGALCAHAVASSNELGSACSNSTGGR